LLVRAITPRKYCWSLVAAAAVEPLQVNTVAAAAVLVDCCMRLRRLSKQQEPASSSSSAQAVAVVSAVVAEIMAPEAPLRRSQCPQPVAAAEVEVAAQV
jgi:hypothetical protein